MEKILEFFGGTDRVLHFLVGAVLSFMFTNVSMLQDGVLGTSCIIFGLIGFAVAAFAGIVKELIIDSTFDWKDFVATLLGGILPVVVNAIGALFFVLSN